MEQVKLTFLTKDAATQVALKQTPHILRPDAEAEPIAPRDGKKFREAELLEILDCRSFAPVQIGRSGLWFLIDDEGKLSDKPYNHLATKFWLTIQPEVKGWDYVAGTCIVCRRNLIS